jgi:hypothetical protein
MKIALCFIISYRHILNKENIWREWIKANEDIINVYFHCKNRNLIKSEWIQKHCIPPPFIKTTSYYHVVPAYISVLSFAFSHDLNNKWFCLLTDSCAPIIHPTKFRELFFNYCYASIMKWSPSYWNIDIHTRANLKYMNKEYHLANDPWFTLSRDHVHKCMIFVIKKQELYQKICQGGLANESIFAIILQTFKQLSNSLLVINNSSTITDWNRMSSATSPHLFSEGNKEDINFISNQLTSNKYAMFIRKISPLFPDEILEDFIYKKKYNHTYTNMYRNNVNYFIKYLNLLFLLFVGALFYYLM